MVKAVSQQVLISASIYTCNLTLVVKPEKRLPVNNNWSNTNQIQIEDINTNNIVASFSMNMNNLGIGTINLCANNIFLNEGNYNFYITGFSHLRKKFSNIYSFNIQNITHDLTGTNNFLLAGEISNTFDNKINSLDVSKLIDNMYTNDVKSDLNRDGSVNFLDINIIVTNFLKHGE
ncbi:MAG: hypothetical protein NZZ41_03750 [Candidatus Dojkabacteria bacterium]|nr:hypothetical protein [Candidatus Dojkabacteria bacterium]